MPMTIVVTRNTTERFRGFLSTCMLEIAAGVYTAPRMNRAVRERVQVILEDWAGDLGTDAGILMTWADNTAAGGQRLWTLGMPKEEIFEVDDADGLLLLKRDLLPDDILLLQQNKTIMQEDS